MPDTGFARGPGDSQRALIIDVFGDLLIGIAHRVIRDGRQMDDGIDAGKVGRGNGADVPKLLRIQRAFRQNRIQQIRGEVAGIEPDQPDAG